MTTCSSAKVWWHREQWSWHGYPALEHSPFRKRRQLGIAEALLASPGSAFSGISRKKDLLESRHKRKPPGRSEEEHSRTLQFLKDHRIIEYQVGRDHKDHPAQPFLTEVQRVITMLYLLPFPHSFSGLLGFKS